MKKVFLDAGHGGKDPGGSGNGLIEKHIALSVVKKIGEILKRHGVEVGYSRTTDVFVELSEIARQANLFNADVFASIHTNAFSNTAACGVETFNYPNSSNGSKLATNIHNAILENKLYTKDRGVKTANFAVLRNTKMPSTLVELGFITNAEDAMILRNKQNEFAESIAKGILKHLDIKYKDDNKKPVTEEIERKNIVRIKKGSKIIEVDGFLEKGTNYVSVREVFEKLGCKVSWDSKNQIVVID